MSKLTRDDLMSLEQYSEQRNDFRAQVMRHKKNRVVVLGPHMTLHFEDRMLMHYQIQEMLRAEKIFDAEGIQEELDTYNDLIPDGDNWKATMMIEYTDVAERDQALKQLLGVELRVWMSVGEGDRHYAVADEDLERETAEKTSAVHFLRFQLDKSSLEAAYEGAAINLGVDHDAYRYVLEPLALNFSDSLRADLK